MAEYKPSLPFTTPIILLIPEAVTVKGSTKKRYPSIENGELIFCSFKTYGGTERSENGVYSVEDTANIETWYRPDIKSDCRIILAETEAAYEIINEPEDVNQRHMYCLFKVRRIKGGA